MENYLWLPYCNSAYVLKDETDIEKNMKNTYVVEYPIKYDNIWRFVVETEDLKTNETETDSWELDAKEIDEIKNYIRTILKPSDFYEEEVG